jgi:hypothetical protein
MRAGMSRPSQITCHKVRFGKIIVKDTSQRLPVAARASQTDVCEMTWPMPDPYLTGYARVSKGDEQSNAAQITALKAAGCRRVFGETASGGRGDRPVLQDMIKQLRDVLVVWRLDRLTRSQKTVPDLLLNDSLGCRLGAAWRLRWSRRGGFFGEA